MNDRHMSKDDIIWYIECNNRANSKEGIAFLPEEVKRHDRIRTHLAECEDCKLRAVVVHFTIKAIQRNYKTSEEYAVYDIRR